MLLVGIKILKRKFLANRKSGSDMENALSVSSAACVKFQSGGKFLALNIRCFVVNALSVAISRGY